MLKLRERIYLLITMIFAVVSTVYVNIVYSYPTSDGNLQLEFVMFVGSYPIIFVVFHSSLRLYLLPLEIFDPYTGISQNDSLKFRKYNMLISIIGLFGGISLLLLPQIINRLFNL